MKYRRFFDIDPEYFPQVNEAVIRSKPDMWRSFYPHEAFVKLMKAAIAVLSSRQKVSLWVEGAYGTGKSYAALTMQKLLDADAKEVEGYFSKYEGQIDQDLKNQFLQVKTGKPILTVHRYGSANIHGDDQLLVAVQESITQALLQKGYSHTGADSALKGATLQWLENPINRKYFAELMAGPYKDTFTGDTVEGLVDKLDTYTGPGLESLMGKVMKVGRDKGFKAMSPDMNTLLEWIEAVIEENQLKAIVFIWDEFTEYFKSNMRALTGFQQLVELSATSPFYLMLVTHNVQNEFPEGNQDWRKISDRFYQPFCEITLPENIAFRLLGAAMEKEKDPQVRREWDEITEDLHKRTSDSRKLVKEKAGISEQELKDILPIHPYAALLLKHISSAFASNQRSMFDFIKNDRGDEIKGFQWFINNRGPLDDGNPLLTIDLLWDFFYERGREHLTTDIQGILDTYPRVERQLDPNQKRVLKTVLLLQAISRRVGDSVELFVPYEKNIDLAFEGSDLDNGQASRLADSMARMSILFKDTTGGKNQFSALVNAADTAELDRLRETHRRTSTSQLIQEAEMASALSLDGPLRLRYEPVFVSAGDFRQKVNQLRGQAEAQSNQIMVVFSFARDDKESIDVGKRVRDTALEASNQVIFVDASVTPVGHDLFEQYVDAMANSAYQTGKDRQLAAQYSATAKDVLRRWRTQVLRGEFIIYTPEKQSGERFHTFEDVIEQLSSINRRYFPNGLETMGAVIDGMWQSNSLAAGVQCGATQTVSGQYRSANPQTKLERFIGEDAWTVPLYWEQKPHLPISQLKVNVEKVIQQSFDETGRVSINKIYEVFQDAPYGFLPCNLTAFILGFLLKEYPSGNFSYSDSITNDELTVDKLKDMVSELIKHRITPMPRYTDKFIVTMTQEEKAFNDAASAIFGIPRNQCASVEKTRERIRQEMKRLVFPLWSIKPVLEKKPLKTDSKVVAELVDGFVGIANSENYGFGKTDNDIAQDIGKLVLAHPGVVEDLQSVVTKDSCTQGMKAYLQGFEGGILVKLSEEIGDNGQFLNQLHRKFDADAANWVWNLETAHQKIRELILDYQIIAASNKVLAKSVSLDEAVREWLNACRNIRISYLFAANVWEELAPLMGLLYHMKRSGVLDEAQKNKFLEQVSGNGEAFNRFYNNQQALFARICEYLLRGLPAESIPKIYNSLPLDIFTSEKAEYQAKVERAVSTYKEEQDTLRLADLWKEKTGSQTPRAWSRTHKMPILALVTEGDQKNARDAFDALHRRMSEKGMVQKAIRFLESATFFEAMNDAAARDQAFKDRVIKTLQIMLDDVEEVKEYLASSVTLDPFDWYLSPEVERRLQQMAEAKYNREGSMKALGIIDNMETQEVKRYLKDLIRDNMTVGMEIIKEGGGRS